MKTVDDIFNEIYDATYTSCLIYVTCKCRNTQDIPDILQETYMSLYNILAKKGSSHIKNYEAYVISIAKSKVYKQYSLQERLRYIIPLFGKNKEDEDYNHADLLEDNFSNTLEDRIINQSTLDSIWGFLKTKPENIQKVFFLYYSADMTIPEISSLLKINESTIKNWIYRTRKEIQIKFGKEDINHD